MLDLSADDLADLHAPDAVYEFPLLSPSRPERYEGREAIRDGFREAWEAAPVRVDAIEGVVVYETREPEVIVAEHTARATVTTTGEPFVLPVLLVLRHAGGLIAHVRDYADALRGARALGRLPELVARLEAPGA
jgi:ketosteroid isomerase-like protein